MIAIQLLGLADGTPTPFDGEYVARYEPTKWQWEEVGSLDEMFDKIRGWLETTPDVHAALHFPDVAAAADLWRTELQTVRPWDGKPNRPLTAFSVRMERVPDAPA